MRRQKAIIILVAWMGWAVCGCLGQTSGAKLWELTLSPRISSSPALSTGGVLYLGAGPNLVAVNPDGSKAWQFATKGEVNSSPAIGHNGLIYFGSLDSYLYALTNSGVLAWRYRTSGRIYSSPAIDADGTIYFGSDDKNLYALTSSGQLKWTFPTGGFVRSSPAIGADGTVFFGSWDNLVYAVRPDGTLRWSFPTGHYVFSSPAIGADGTIYIGSADFYLYALNPDGARKWAYKTAGHIYASPAIGPDGTVYVGSWDNKLYALTPAGTRKWEFLTGNLVQSCPAIAGDGTIYFGSDEHKLYALYSDGAKKWSFTAGSLVRSSPVLGADGKVYFGAEDARLYALNGSKKLAESSWAMFRGDPGHRGKVVLTLTNQPIDQLVIVGQTASFSVAASGTGPLSYQWRQDATNLASGLSPQLLLTNVQPEQAGDYTVVITNSVEKITSAAAALKVMVRPVFTLQPTSQVVTVGSNLTLRVTANSLGPLTYQWRFAGTNLPGRISPDLSLLGVQPGQAGEYAVVVSNPAGAVTSAVASLTVVTPPEIVAPPQSLALAAGAKATFAVEAKSLSPPSYQWCLNGTNLPGATASNLVLNSVQPAHSGYYSVIVKNMAGTVQSPQAQLVVALPPGILSPPKSQSGILGKTATLSVSALSDGPSYFQWYLNHQAIAGANNSNYTLTSLQATQAGSYKVVVTNVAGAVTSLPALLSIQYPPVILAHPLTQTGSLGKDIVFSVLATGTPTLTYTWLWNGTNLPGTTNSILVLKELKPGQDGTYTVLVTNKAGAATSQPARLVAPTSRGFWGRLQSWFDW